MGAECHTCDRKQCFVRAVLRALRIKYVITVRSSITDPNISYCKAGMGPFKSPARCSECFKVWRTRRSLATSKNYAREKRRKPNRTETENLTPPQARSRLLQGLPPHCWGSAAIPWRPGRGTRRSAQRGCGGHPKSAPQASLSARKGLGDLLPRPRALPLPVLV